MSRLPVRAHKAAMAGSFERFFKTVHMVNILGHGQGPGTKTPLIPGMVRIPFDLVKLAIFYMSQYPTAAVASGSGRPGGGFNYAGIVGRHRASFYKAMIK
jgi:hypothetical protein